MKKTLSAVREFVKKADMLLLFLICVCTIFGIILISSATKSYGTNNYIYIQTGAFIIGIFLFIVFSIIDIDIIADKWKFLLAFSILFISTLFIWGVESDTGNRAWLRFFGIGIQPAEIVKISFIILMAKHMAYLKEYRDISAPTSVLTLVLHFGFMFGLIIYASDDLGSALVYMIIFVIMMFASGIKLRWFALGASLLGGAIPLLWNFVLRDDQKERVLAPYVSSIDPTGWGITWQANQGKLALASGQLTGQGLYNGTQTQSSALPLKHNDFIFAVAGEELGLIGCSVIILLLTAIIVRCIYVGLKSRHTIGTLVCFGVAAMLIFQTFENIGMCLGLTPVIGITLPFFSYGGSSIVTLFAAMGLVSGVKMRPKPSRSGS